jgi:hypothetical protein
MAGCSILPQPAMTQLIESVRLKGSLRRAYARPSMSIKLSTIALNRRLAGERLQECPRLHTEAVAG